MRMHSFVIVLTSLFLAAADENGNPVCGDGILDAGEECDPQDDHCAYDCQLIVCGDGRIDGPEGCDPPGLTEPTCMDNCQLHPLCGNGMYELGEQCDTPGEDGCDENCMSDRVPTAWTCPYQTYGDGHVCDCACGALDTDCADATLAACDDCAGPCNVDAGFVCPGLVTVDDNPQCTP